MSQLAKITAADEKLRIRLAEIDAGIREANANLDYSPFNWATRREALKRERAAVERARVELQRQISRDDEGSRPSSSVFYGSNS